VKNLFLQGKRKWGWRTIRMKLEQQGIIMNHKKIQRIMKQNNLVTSIRKRNPYKNIMKKDLEHRTAPNVLNREFSQKTPYRILCTDITYMKFNHRFVYLSTVKDICSGQIVAWYVDYHLHLPLVLKTLEKLNKKYFNGALLHSDQGWHYTHPTYIKQLLDLNITQSMSRKGNCIDNASMESFFGHMKDEIEYTDCESFEDLRKRVDEYMYYYNHERPQWNKNKMTPIQYRDHMLSY
jgi:transposase InsO family protein